VTNKQSVFQIAMKFKEIGAWESIPMPHSLFAGGGMDSVCGGIEVLSDYTVAAGNKILLGKSKPASKQLKRKSDAEPPPTMAVKKKKPAASFTITDISNPAESTVPQSKAKTKKKKKKNEKPAVDLSKLAQHLAKSAKNEAAPPAVSAIPVEAAPITSKSAAKVEKLAQKGLKKLPDKAEEGVMAADMSEWRELFVCEEILRALAERGFSCPTPIQKLSLPAALQGILLGSESGRVHPGLHIHSFIHPSIHSSVRPSIDPFIYSFIHTSFWIRICILKTDPNPALEMHLSFFKKVR
jgi:hypothetical protein